MKNICTVLLVTYNHAPYVAKCIESVLSQKTKYSFVIKIFDDASTDGSSDIIKEYACKYPDKIQAFISPKNQGAQTNIWNAYKSVDTKYCILTETDDYWCSDLKLESQISALENNPDCSFCSTNNLVEVIEDKYLSHKNGQPEIKPRTFSSNIITYEDIEKIPCGFLTHISSRLIRTSSLNIEEIKHKESILFDASQFFYLLTKGNMYWIDKIFSVYVKTGTGVCSSAVASNRLSAYWRAMIDLNEDTKGVCWGKIAEQLCLVSTVWVNLSKEKKTFSTLIPFQRFSKDNIEQKKFFGIDLTKIIETEDTIKILFLGLTIFKIRKT